MENATENKFYSRRLTNEMRTLLINNITKHIDTEFVNNPLYKECLEQINEFTKTLWEEIYSVMPKEDVDTILKYKEYHWKKTVSFSKTPSYRGSDAFPYSENYWGDSVTFGPNLIDNYIIPANIRNNDIFDKTLERFGVDKCKKLYDTLNINKCEKEKILGAMKRIINSATTTGKLVEAYPEMMKFIPDSWKKKEQNHKTIPTTVASVDVDVNAFLK